MFLNFWTKYNVAIIEVLIGVILLLLIFLQFRFFLKSKEGASDVGKHDDPLPLDMEKALRKLMEAQALAPTSVQAPTTAGAAKAATPVAAAPLATPAAVPTAVTSVNSAELEKLKKEIQEKDKLLAQMQSQAAAAAAAPAANPDASKALEGKIKDLEARLAEYEIISEDIADLSFYKEENARLQSEISGLKGGPPAEATPAAAPAAPEGGVASVDPEPVPAPAAAVAPTPEPTPAPTPVAPAPSAAAPESAVIATDAPAAGAAVEAPKENVDESLMKDFAVAVQEQKAAEGSGQIVQAGGAPTAGTASGDGTAAPAAAAPELPPASKLDDNSQLMNQFENFVKKA